MSSAQEFFARLGKGSTWAEQVAAVKAEHGRDASHWLAARLGKSLRTAQRYLSGQIKRPGKDTPPAGLAALQRIGDRSKAAATVRGIRTVNVGAIEVYDTSGGRSDGLRRPGPLDVAGGMDEVARALEAGDVDLAADLFNGSVLAVYDSGAGHAASRDGLGEQMQITDYRDGIEYQ